MPETDLSLLLRAAEGAGDVALRFAGPSARVWDKPGGAGPVTEADLAVNAHLLDILRAARPEYGWLSEETEDDQARLSADTVFIVDPIDGTRSFIEGGRTWAHSIAVAHKGLITAGVVFLPMRGMMYAAAQSGGATLNGARLKASRLARLDDGNFLAAKPMMEPRFWSGQVPDFTRGYRPSLAYRLALVGQGRFDGMITFRPTWEWDVAAGSLIAQQAGAQVADRAGAPLRFNQPDPRTHGIITAAPDVHSELIRRHIPDA